ncbi:MAG TPA: type III secretion system export apparatus subunit SctS [Herbaspirillum sp.]|jgi:type III secretion HrpO family protein
MNPDDIASLVMRTLYITIRLSLPLVALGTIAGVLTSLFQAATQIQDQTFPFLTKLTIILVGLAILGGWMGRELQLFTIFIFDYLAEV